jgi:hypothetical protein
VLWLDRSIGRREIERHSVVEFDHLEGTGTGLAPAALVSRPENGRTLPGLTSRRWCG